MGNRPLEVLEGNAINSKGRLSRVCSWVHDYFVCYKITHWRYICTSLYLKIWIDLDLGGQLANAYQEGFSVLLQRRFGGGEDGSPDVEPHPLWRHRRRAHVAIRRHHAASVEPFSDFKCSFPEKYTSETELLSSVPFGSLLHICLFVIINRGALLVVAVRFFATEVMGRFNNGDLRKKYGQFEMIFIHSLPLNFVDIVTWFIKMAQNSWIHAGRGE